jgi:hypothetical protein
LHQKEKNEVVIKKIGGEKEKNISKKSQKQRKNFINTARIKISK